MSPRVTILLPVRNPDPRFFDEALRSVFQQTFPDWRLLVVESGSAPETEACLSKFDACRIQRLGLSAESTLTEQLNAGLHEAASELIVRMDADDICRLDRIERQVAFLDQNPDVDVVGSWLEGIDAQGGRIGFRRYPVRHDEIVETLMRYNCLGHPAVAFRRGSVLSAGAYRLAGRPGQDYELWCRMASQGYRFANIPEPLLRYRLHQGAGKCRRLAETIRSTLEVKRTYWGATMPLDARLRYWGEAVMLSLPPAWTLAAFRWMEFRSSP